jgi:hypothetical protein
MRKFFLLLLILITTPFIFGFNQTISSTSIDLNGNWKFVSYLTPGINGIDDDVAKKQIGRIIEIRSNVLEVDLARYHRKCKIIDSPKFIEKKGFAWFDPMDQGALGINDFNLSDHLYIFTTKAIESNYNFREFIVDSDKNKMVLPAEGGYFLFVRQENNQKN